ncbi:hypothetical protein E2C01_047322 [Portunus trituberculatus]|uniref:Uncharacterized protein n=1 Tax=Portunus trituberculatus TaxID=210409 RepID=A0A5B7G3B0_PORTR|nr:hypothetical protein [Portunus trituberculatus]
MATKYDPLSPPPPPTPSSSSSSSSSSHGPHSDATTHRETTDSPIPGEGFSFPSIDSIPSKAKPSGPTHLTLPTWS